MKILGTVILPSFEYERLQQLERGYRNTMWKYHEALTKIANGDDCGLASECREIARQALGVDTVGDSP